MCLFFIFCISILILSVVFLRADFMADHVTCVVMCYLLIHGCDLRFWIKTTGLG